MKKLWQIVGVVSFWLTWPGLWVVLRGSRRTRVIINYKDEVLLVKRWLGSGAWLLPGGGLRRSEATLDGAIRETAEETGIDLKPHQLNLVGEYAVREYGISFRIVVFRTNLTARRALQPPKLEITDAAWQSKGQWKKLSPVTQRLLEG